MRQKLFYDLPTTDYFNRVYLNLKSRINELSDEEILNNELLEYSEYFYQEYHIPCIRLMDNAIKESVSKTTVERANRLRTPYEPAYFTVDAFKFSYQIPFDGDPFLLRTTPSARLLSSFECDNLVQLREGLSGYIVFSIDIPQSELTNHSGDLKDFVGGLFEKKFASYRTMIEYANNDAEKYNTELKPKIMQLLKERKDKADTFLKIKQVLNISSDTSDNPSEIISIKLKRTPSPKYQVLTNNKLQEYTINDEDYQNIKSIIYSSCSSMEQTARSHSRRDEEELRDVITASLGTHYDNTTGETFRKTGKTDIYIPFDNKAAYIAECKIWHGEKKLAEAVNQLLRYTTWKDLKISLIVFNTVNNDFKNILSTIDNWVNKNAKSCIKAKQNWWDCVYYDNDKQLDIALNIQAFDLYIKQ